MISKSLLFSRSLSTGGRRLMKKGIVSPMNTVPEWIRKPTNLESSPNLSILNDYEIEGMRQAGRIAKKVCEFAGTLVKPGVTLDYIDRTTHEYACSLGFYPTCLGYEGFPKSISISVNEVVLHGIPDDTVLEDGDIVKVDLFMFVRGFHGDTCRTFECGKVDDDGKRLIRVTKECLDKAIAVCKSGAPFIEIGKAIFNHAQENGFDVIRDYVGHGIGRYAHMQPYVFHYPIPYPVKPMVKNQVFTIEPMLVEGSHKIVTWDDKWTVATKDNGRSAQFEHTIIITDDGAEVLT